jgi:hypothetical protein
MFAVLDTAVHSDNVRVVISPWHDNDEHASHQDTVPVANMSPRAIPRRHFVSSSHNIVAAFLFFAPQSFDFRIYLQ